MKRVEKVLSYLPTGRTFKVTAIEGRKVAFYQSTVDFDIVVIAVNDLYIDYIRFTQYLMVEQVLDSICNC